MLRKLYSLKAALLVPFVLLISGVAILIGGLSYRTGVAAVDELANRATLMTRLESALRRGSRQHDSGQMTALLYMDLNRFKAINDEHGHEFGDAVLAGTGRRLRGCARDGDTVARIGGDEFAAVLPQLRDAAAAQVVADKIRTAIAAPMHVLGRKFSIGIAIGIAIAPQDGRDAEALLHAADQAMYSNKRTQAAVVTA